MTEDGIGDYSDGIGDTPEERREKKLPNETDLNVNNQVDEVSDLDARVLACIRKLTPANAEKVVIFAMGLAAAENIYRQATAAPM